MSWSYSGDPSESELDELRFLLSDTDQNSPIFSDEELQYLIDTYGDNRDKLEYYAFEAAATQFARQIKRSLGPQSEDPSGRLAYFKSKADSAKKKLSVKGLSVPKYQYPKVFRKGMMDNPPSRYGGNYV